MKKTITENKTKIFAYIENKISKKLPVFYNPKMKLNRDISILLLNSLSKKQMQIALPLSGSGIRGIRFLQELKKGKIKNITFNDHSKDAVKLIENNLELNEIDINKEIKIKKKDLKNIKQKKNNLSYNDANLFLLESSGFDYIDIDPFGTPNPFLNNAIIRLARNGILAVTATDTSALAGTYPNACIRKYWSVPLRNELKHEIGIRILIRKVQLIASQFEKALTPIFSHSTDHYMRVYFQAEKGKTKVDKILKQLDYYNNIGPIWTGQLWDNKLTKKMLKNTKNNPDLYNLIKTIADESQIPTLGFYEIHEICKRNKIHNPPKHEIIIKKIKSRKFKVSKTHFNKFGLRSDIDEETFINILKRT
ncbi:tRNA (guanine(26)-N(2))-dimethyltransferase [Nanoarchaeota archaeon]